MWTKKTHKRIGLGRNKKVIHLLRGRFRALRSLAPTLARSRAHLHARSRARSLQTLDTHLLKLVQRSSVLWLPCLSQVTESLLVNNWKGNYTNKALYLGLIPHIGLFAKALVRIRHSLLLFYISLGHTPVKFGSAVVGAMTSVFVAIDGVAVGRNNWKGNYTNKAFYSELVSHIGPFPKAFMRN